MSAINNYQLWCDEDDLSGPYRCAPCSFDSEDFAPMCSDEEIENMMREDALVGQKLLHELNKKKRSRD